MYSSRSNQFRSYSESTHGVFVLISATPVEDVAIPGESFSFGTLEQAQATGDFASLDAAGRRAVHAHLPSQDPALIRALADTLLTGVKSG